MRRGMPSIACVEEKYCTTTSVCAGALKNWL